MRVTLPVTAELLSDAIFGSGFSIPGGEDIAVCRDEKGYPYIKGATLKGLLRESLENLLEWTGAGPELAETLLGIEGWPGLAEPRRLQLTALCPEHPPEDPEDCYGDRTFTSLEDGIVKEGTLRTASCIRRGMTFSGEIICDEEDVATLRDALAGIKWAGTMRSRGFGRLRVRAGEAVPVLESSAAAAGRCLHYRLHNQLPIQITDLDRSGSNSYETQGFIPGSAVRGAVMSRLSARKPEWFADNKAALLSIRFLDALPNPKGAAALPSPKGFYEDKAETTLQNVVQDGTFDAGMKRAKLGSFCALKGGKIEYWSGKTAGTTRIQRGREGKDTAPFQVRYLSAGQDFDGYILLDDPALAPEIAKALGDSIWLGADRYAGCGQCRVTELEAVEQPAWLDAYGYQKQEEVTETLYLLAVSPLTMLDASGDPCGLDEARLAEMLGVGSVQIPYCSTSITRNGSYNRVWQCRAPAVRMYDRGSLFHLVCDRPPELAAIRKIQAGGLGIRQPEGFGQVLFLPPALLEGLTRKSAPQEDQHTKQNPAAAVRRAKYQWVMDHTAALMGFRLSKSQVGTIQALCEKARAQNGDCTELYDHLTHNLEDRGAEHGHRFQEINRFIHAVLDQPLRVTLGVECPEDSVPARLELLCLLFDHSRKGRKEED